MFRNLRHLSVGNNVYIGPHTEILASEKGLIIGDHVMIAEDVIINSSNHNFKNPNIPMDMQKQTTEKIEIKDDAWIGTRSIVLAGVTINK